MTEGAPHQSIRRTQPLRPRADRCDEAPTRRAISWLDPAGPPAWGALPLWAAAVVVAAEAASWWFDLWVYPGGVPLSPAAVVGGGAVAMSARRARWGLPAVPLLSLFAVAALGALVQLGPVVPMALAMAAAGEEAVYRLGVPVLVVWVLRRFGWGGLLVPAVAVGTATAVFAFLPGHAEQFSSSPLGPLPWVAVAVLWAWMLWRGMSIAVVAYHHAALNCVAFSVGAGAPSWWWTAAVAVPSLGWMAAEAYRDRNEQLAARLRPDMSFQPGLADSTP